jgi:hypothetical protein
MPPENSAAKASGALSARHRRVRSARTDAGGKRRSSWRRNPPKLLHATPRNIFTMAFAYGPIVMAAFFLTVVREGTVCDTRIRVSRPLLQLFPVPRRPVGWSARHRRPSSTTSPRGMRRAGRAAREASAGPSVGPLHQSAIRPPRALASRAGCLRAPARRLSHDEIAASLAIGRDAVDDDTNVIYRRLDVHSRHSLMSHCPTSLRPTQHSTRSCQSVDTQLTWASSLPPKPLLLQAVAQSSWPSFEGPSRESAPSG